MLQTNLSDKETEEQGSHFSVSMEFSSDKHILSKQKNH